MTIPSDSAATQLVELAKSALKAFNKIGSLEDEVKSPILDNLIHMVSLAGEVEHILGEWRQLEDRFINLQLHENEMAKD